MCVCDLQCVIDGLGPEGFGARVVSVLIINTHVFGNLVYPGVEGGVAFKVWQCNISLYPCLLYEVLCCGAVLYLSVNESIDFGIVFFDECFGAALLCALNAGFFVEECGQGGERV